MTGSSSLHGYVLDSQPPPLAAEGKQGGLPGRDQLQILLLVQTVAVTVSVSLGLGRHFYHVDTFDNIIIIARLGQVNVVSSILAAVLSKTSFAVTLLRLGEKTTAFKAVVWFIIISINVFMNTGIVSWQQLPDPIYGSKIFDTFYLDHQILNYAQCTPVRKVWETWILGECWPRDIVPKYNAFAAGKSRSPLVLLQV